MSSINQEEQLLAKLHRSLGDGQTGFAAVPDMASGILILNKGHYRGVWHWRDGTFAFTPGGYGTSTYATMTSQEALRYTLDHVCRQ